MATQIITYGPGREDYPVYQGDTWEPDPVTVDVAGVLINFTGYSAKMEIRTTLSGDLIKTLTSPSGGITMTTLGVITFTMTATETSALPAGEYKYDLQVTYPSGKIKTYLVGLIIVTGDITDN